MSNNCFKCNAEIYDRVGETHYFICDGTRYCRDCWIDYYKDDCDLCKVVFMGDLDRFRGQTQYLISDGSESEDEELTLEFETLECRQCNSKGWKLDSGAIQFGCDCF